MTRILILGLALTLAGCSGLNAARQMPAAEIAELSNEEVCNYLATFAYKGRIPDAWEDAAVSRGLTRCIERGIDRRAEDRKIDRARPVLCPQGTATQDSRCW